MKSGRSFRRGTEMSHRTQVLQLYKQMLREAAKWPNYSYRTYAQRKIKWIFRQNRSLEQSRIEEAVQRAQENLALIQRQVVVGLMYKSNELVIEKAQR